MWWKQVAPLYVSVTFLDWLLALAVASGLAAVATMLILRAPRSSEREAATPRLGVLGLALLFSVASYLPIWLWYIAPRHHFLPSIGLFAGGAVCLAWFLDNLRARMAQVLVVLLLGVTIFLFAAADRGESRYWEDAFTSKKQFSNMLASRILRSMERMSDGRARDDIDFTLVSFAGRCFRVASRIILLPSSILTPSAEFDVGRRWRCRTCVLGRCASYFVPLTRGPNFCNVHRLD